MYIVVDKEEEKLFNSELIARLYADRRAEETGGRVSVFYRCQRVYEVGGKK